MPGQESSFKDRRDFDRTPSVRVKVSAILKKRALSFTLTLRILAESLLSLKLLSCPGICGTGTKVDWPGKNERSLSIRQLAFRQSSFCYSVFVDYSPVLALASLELLSFQTTLLSCN